MPDVEISEILPNRTSLLHIHKPVLTNSFSDRVIYMCKSEV